MDDETRELLKSLADAAAGVWRMVDNNATGVDTLPESQATIVVAFCQIALQLDRIATILEHQV